MENQIAWIKKGEFAIIEFLLDRIDLFETSKYLAYIEKKLAENGYSDIVVDLSNAMFIDSSGIGTLIALQSRLQKNSKEMIVVSDNETILKVFEITKMYDFFKVVSTLDEASSYLEKKDTA